MKKTTQNNAVTVTSGKKPYVKATLVKGPRLSEVTAAPCQSCQV